jgi:hypothetical protein
MRIISRLGAIGLLAAGGLTGLAADAGPAAVTSGPARPADGLATGPMQYSSNWSGYVATATAKLSYVSAEWVEPSVSCVGTYPEAAVFWVGLDGWSDDTVEQGGSEAYCDGTTPIYSLWWEMYPTNSIQTAVDIRAGDTVSASVAYSGGSYRIVVTDLTRGAGLSELEGCAAGLTCARSSAEWIAESPSYGNQLANLPRWTRFGFSQGMASVRPDHAQTSTIAVFPNFPVTMTGAQGDRAVPTALGARGEGFSDTWESEAA